MAPRKAPPVTKVEEVSVDEVKKAEIEEVNEKTIVLDETPEVEVTENDLPPTLNVQNKTTGKTFTVNRKYYLANRGNLKLV